MTTGLIGKNGFKEFSLLLLLEITSGWSILREHRRIESIDSKQKEAEQDHLINNLIFMSDSCPKNHSDWIENKEIRKIYEK